MCNQYVIELYQHIVFGKFRTIVYSNYNMINAHAIYSWWRYPMETFSALLAIGAGNLPVTGEIPAQIPVTWSFVVFFDLP